MSFHPNSGLASSPSLGLEVHQEGLTVHEPNDTDGGVQKCDLFFEHDQFGSVSLMNKKEQIFPAPDSPPKWKLKC